MTDEPSESPVEQATDGVARWIDFHGADGISFALPYRDLQSVELPSSEIIILSFRNHRVTVRGRNLTPVHDAVLAERLARLREDDEDWVSEAETFVSEVVVERNT
jgi:hypothetical protein